MRLPRTTVMFMPKVAIWLTMQSLAMANEPVTTTWRNPIVKQGAVGSTIVEATPLSFKGNGQPDIPGTITYASCSDVQSLESRRAQAGTQQRADLAGLQGGWPDCQAAYKHWPQHRPARYPAEDLLGWRGASERSGPISDFFLDAFSADALPFATMYFGNHGKHWYCYLPMPFKTGARIEVENQSTVDDKIVAYDVGLEEWEACPADMGRFHACWRRENPTQPGRAYTMLDIKGRGHFVGCSLSVQAFEKTLSFLEGLTRIYIDDQEDPALKVWGTEDFLGGSYYLPKEDSNDYWC